MSATVSVVIPCFNYARYLGAAIDSVLSQTWPPTQIIVVDDGSTDGSADLARGFGAPVDVVTQANGGIASARNSGIRAVDGEFLAFLDADDLWAADKLEKQLAAFRQQPELDCVFSHAVQFISPELPPAERDLIACPDHPMQARTASTMLARRRRFLEVGYFDETLEIAETVDWLSRADTLGLRTLVLPDVLLRRRLHGANSGVVKRDARGDYARVLKAALDRRRQHRPGRE